jgi:CRP/FNR family cyclic AMP-dependent transcriptional regulator
VFRRRRVARDTLNAMKPQSGTIPTSQALADLGVWHLRHVDLFKAINGEVLNRFTRLLRLREFKGGEVVYVISGSRDEHMQRMYFLLKGCVKLSSADDASGKELLLLVIKPGEPFGLLNAVGNDKTDLRAVAMQASLVAYVPREDFDKLIHETHTCSRLVKLIGERSVEVVSRFEDLAFQSVPVRLARVLLRLAHEFPKQRTCGICIDIPLTQQEVANLIGARREVVSTHLSRLKSDGTLALHKKYICIHDHAALEKLSN